MGYVGIPNALLFANNKETDFVYGIQRESSRSSRKINELNEGKIPFSTYEEEMDVLLQQALDSNKFSCTSNYRNINDCDAVIISVQTPFKNKTEPDYSALESAISETCKHIRPGTLVSIESTITPGYTETIAKPTIQKLSGQPDILLVHAPERVTPGRMLWNIRNLDRVVGGINPTSTSIGSELYKRIVINGKIIETDATTAEVIKTSENTFRDLQIAAINQLALYCEAIGVNVYDVRRGIDSLEGYGVTRSVLWPGAGVGGHCLTKDTYHLERGVKTSHGPFDFPMFADSLYTTARSINDFMPIHMFNLAQSGLITIGKSMHNANVAVLGLSYNHDSDDMRDTPTGKFCKMLETLPIKVVIHDPYADQYQGELNTTSFLDVAVKSADVVLLFTAHKEYYQMNPLEIKVACGKEHPVIVDGRNVIDPNKFIRNGFVYRGIGRGDKNQHTIIHCGDDK